MARRKRGDYTTENEWQAELARPAELSRNTFGGVGITNLESDALGMPAGGPGREYRGELPAAPMAGGINAEAQRRRGAEGGGMPPVGFVRGVVENNPVMAPMTELVTAIDNSPRLFVDSDGRARAGYNMGGEAGLVPADRAGVPIGMQMVPVQGLSQGSMSIGRDLAAGPPAPMALRPEELPVAPGVANERYGRAVGAMGGFVAPPMNAREQARANDMDATRAARWDQRGSTTQVDRAVGQIRSQGAALDALNRQTDAQIRVAQGTPQVQAGAAGVGAWDPVNKRVVTDMRPADPGNAPTMEERVAKLAQAKKAIGGKDLDMGQLMALNQINDPAERQRRWMEMTEGNPELDQLLGDVIISMLKGGGAAPAPGSGSGQPGPGVNAGAQNGIRPTGGVADKYRRQAK